MTGDEDSGARAGQGSGTFTRFAGEVDFPGFVADLVKGVFHAIVDASIQQMEAYSELLDKAASSMGEFVRENLPDRGRDCLDDLFSASGTKD